MKSSFAPPRKHLRVAWRMPFAIRLVAEGVSVPAVTYNLSAGGCLAFCGRTLPEGAAVVAHLELIEKDPSPLELTAVIVRQEDQGDGLVAIAFQGTSAVDMARLRQAVMQRAMQQMVTIAEFPAFWNLSDLDLLALASVCHEVHLPPGTHAARHGDEAHSVYLVKRGAVQLRAPFTKQNVDPEVEVARAGQLFGEVSALLGLPHNLDVIAVEPTELLVIPRSALLYLRDYNPNLAVCLYEIFAAFMGRRVRKLTGRLISPLSY